MNQRPSQPVIEHTPAQPDSTQKKAPGTFKISTSGLRAYTMVLALIVVWLLFTWATGGIFLEARNFSNLMRQTAVTGVLAVGMLMVIVSGHIDLSVGSVVGLTGGVAAMLLTWLGWGLAPSLAVAIVVGAGIGVLQGTLVAYANVPAFIVTLGGLLIWRGIIKGVSRGSTIPVELRSFKFIGQGYVAPAAGIAIAVVAVAAIVLINVRRIRARSRHGLAAHSVTNTVFRIVVPSTTAAASDGTSPQPSHVSSMAAMPPVRPATDPTERSICPLTMTISMPTASTPVTAVCRIKLEKLRASRKTPPVAQVKSSQTTISARTIV
jgi:D-xylose transport system permease protein